MQPADAEGRLPHELQPIARARLQEVSGAVAKLEGEAMMFAYWRRSFDPTNPTQPPPGVMRALARAFWRWLTGGPQREER